MIRRILALVLVVWAFAAPAGADADVCGPPRCEPGVLNVDGDDFPFNVLLPTGYDDSDRRYPVLYLFHTAFTDQDQWLERSDVEAFTADRDVIVVMPYQGPIGAVMEPEQRYEAFDLALIGHIDQTYRTIGDRAHRAVAGVSGGAYLPPTSPPGIRTYSRASAGSRPPFTTSRR